MGTNKRNTNPMAGKADPRVFDPANPQPDPHHDVDPSRLDFSKPQPKTAKPLKHTATDPAKMAQEREDFRNERIDDGEIEDLMLAPNPMEETVSRYREDGMEYGFMSDAAVRVLGTRKYEPVKDSRGDPVKLGTLTLGKIPAKIKAARQRRAQAESEERVVSLAQEYTNSVNKLKHDAKDMGLRVIEPGEMQGEFRNTETGRRIQIG